MHNHTYEHLCLTHAETPYAPLAHTKGQKENILASASDFHTQLYGRAHLYTYVHTCIHHTHIYMKGERERERG